MKNILLVLSLFFISSCVYVYAGDEGTESDIEMKNSVIDDTTLIRNKILEVISDTELFGDMILDMLEKYVYSSGISNDTLLIRNVILGISEEIDSSEVDEVDPGNSVDLFSWADNYSKQREKQVEPAHDGITDDTNFIEKMILRILEGEDKEDISSVGIIYQAPLKSGRYERQRVKPYSDQMHICEKLLKKYNIKIAGIKTNTFVGNTDVNELMNKGADLIILFMYWDKIEGFLYELKNGQGSYKVSIEDVFYIYAEEPAEDPAPAEAPAEAY